MNKYLLHTKVTCSNRRSFYFESEHLLLLFLESLLLDSGGGVLLGGLGLAEEVALDEELGEKGKVRGIHHSAEKRGKGCV